MNTEKPTDKPTDVFGNGRAGAWLLRGAIGLLVAGTAWIGGQVISVNNRLATIEASMVRQTDIGVLLGVIGQRVGREEYNRQIEDIRRRFDRLEREARP
jgi:hypothetical protein